MPDDEQTLRAAYRGPSHGEAAYDRYSVGLHHVAFRARSRRRVDERAR